MIDRNDPLRCSLVYHGLVVDTDGDLMPCCQYNNQLKEYRSEELIKFYEFDRYQEQVQRAIHTDAEAGVKHDKCGKCWSEESAGLTTIRQYWNHAFGPTANPEILADNPLYHVEFRLGNFCNLKCLMCHPIASSSIAAEQIANKQRFMDIGMFQEVHMEPYWETEKFKNFVDTSLQDARYLHITGGEPFIIPEVLHILDRVMPNCDTINLSFNTNLTRVSDRLLERLSQFKNLNLYVSLEGVGEMNDYIRYPSRWEDLLANIDRIQTRAPQAVINVQHVFQHTSVYALPKLAQFQTERGFRLFPTLIQGKDFLTFATVPPGDLEQFRVWLADTDLLTEEHRSFMLNTIKDVKFNQDLFVQFRKYVNLLDSIRGTRYNKIFRPGRVDL